MTETPSIQSASPRSAAPSPAATEPELKFAFGENWARFLRVVDDDRISEAERALSGMLELDSLKGLSFLDLGAGSGLSSLAALRLGADRVHSLDVDPESVGCALELRSRYGASSSSKWEIEHASVLDRDHIRSLGQFDIVYSWGVLHHTGDMHTGLDNAAAAVAPGGRLFIAIYNDRGPRTDRWRHVKRYYNRLPRWLRPLYVALVMAPGELRFMFMATLRRRPQLYLHAWTEHKRKRGMSRWHDWVDWVGGYPFEVASAGKIFDFYRARGFSLDRLVTRQGQNEFVFRRVDPAAQDA